MDLSSGVPVISAKLEGIPDDYDDFLIYFDHKKRRLSS